LICERQIACPEDRVVSELNAELLFELLLDINFAQNSKPFSLESLASAFESLLEGKVERAAVAISRLRHGLIYCAHPLDLLIN
jgi:hypothetical protein